MRRKVRILTLAAVVAAVIVPFGFALSVESTDRTGVAVARAAVPYTDMAATVVPTATSGAVIPLPDIPEGAKLLAIGTVLFGVAAAMRRAH